MNNVYGRGTGLTVVGKLATRAAQLVAVTLTMLMVMLMLSPLALGGDGEEGPKEGLYGRPPLPQSDFNRLAATYGEPLLWAEDTDNPGVLDPDELVILGLNVARTKYVEEGGFTAKFEAIYRYLVEMRRQEAILKELNTTRPVLVASDLSDISDQEKQFVGHIIQASKIIDQLYAIQRGAHRFTDAITKADAPSKALFARNQGPWCEGPQTASDPLCNALPSFPSRSFDTYPKGIDHQSSMCEQFQQDELSRQLLNPFTVVRMEEEAFVAKSYLDVYGEQMRAVAEELRLAKKALAGTDEKALKNYLEEAAKGFETNTWEEADEAWVGMSASNSKWYLRIAPDETYWEVCQEKAGFHVSFARIDKRSQEWQGKLNPLREEMENNLASLIGPPYQARQVQFQMPDFIQIVLNAGDSRSPTGATIGQSLPNWGKVAEEGRGRTVVMTNLYTDLDTRALSRQRAGSLLTKASMEHYSDDQLPGLIDIILHEAAHNLGPFSDYRIDGKGPSEIFGGPLASTLEELKAQTAALYYTNLLLKRDVVDWDMALQIYTHAIVWAFGHISTGMFTPTGNPKVYSQLAAVQVGTLMEEGVLEWQEETHPETGKKVGKFHIHLDMMPRAAERLMQKVGQVMAKGDVEGARALIEPYVSGDKKELVRQEEIAERLSNFTRGSLVYSVTF